MTLEQEVEVLRRVPLFANIDPAKLKLLAFTSERVSFKPGQAFFRQGDHGDAAYILLDGVAEVVLQQADGGEVVVATPDRNSILGEIAIICEVPRTATVRAKSQVVTLKITKDLFLRMLRDFPDMGLEVMRTLAHRLDQTTQLLAAARAERAR